MPLRGDLTSPRTARTPVHGCTGWPTLQGRLLERLSELEQYAQRRLIDAAFAAVAVLHIVGALIFEARGPARRERPLHAGSGHHDFVAEVSLAHAGGELQGHLL